MILFYVVVDCWHIYLFQLYRYCLGDRRVSLALMAMGVCLMFWKGMPFDAWLRCIDKNGNLATLFILVPMMFLPFDYGDYQRELKHVAQAHMQSLLPFCMLTFLVAHIFGVIISIGAVTLVYELFKNNAKLYNAEDTFMRSFLREYCTSGIITCVGVYSDCYIRNEDSWIRIIPWAMAFFDNRHI